MHVHVSAGARLGFTALALLFLLQLWGTRASRHGIAELEGGCRQLCSSLGILPVVQQCTCAATSAGTIFENIDSVTDTVDISGASSAGAPQPTAATGPVTQNISLTTDWVVAAQLSDSAALFAANELRHNLSTSYGLNLSLVDSASLLRPDSTRRHFIAIGVPVAHWALRPPARAGHAQPVYTRARARWHPLLHTLTPNYTHSWTHAEPKFIHMPGAPTSRPAAAHAHAAACATPPEHALIFCLFQKARQSAGDLQRPL